MRLTILQGSSPFMTLSHDVKPSRNKVQYIRWLQNCCQRFFPIFMAFFSSKLYSINTRKKEILHKGTFFFLNNGYFFSILIRASTAITCFSVASSGLISISFISVAKRSNVESRTIISANLFSFTPLCPRVPLIIL